MRCEFMDEESHQIWDELRKRVRQSGWPSTLDPEYRDTLRRKVASYQVSSRGRLPSCMWTLLDDRSDFYEQLRIKVIEETMISVQVSHANVIANTVVYISLVLRACNVIMRAVGGR